MVVMDNATYYILDKTDLKKYAGRDYQVAFCGFLLQPCYNA